LAGGKIKIAECRKLPAGKMQKNVEQQVICRMANVENWSL